jgi:peptidoglycan/xylan/chitin deacetylase (PgdA/CDA1 family)
LSRKVVAILAYHKIGDPPAGSWDTWHYIDEGTFRQQMRWIADGGWEVLDLPTFLNGIDHPHRAADRGLLLTFDDGPRSMHDIVLPILREFAYPGVCFVPTAYVGGHNAFDEGVEPREPMCNWEDLRELVSGGVEVQSHGVSHTWLSLLSRAELEWEVAESKRVLETQLKRPVVSVAFPYSDGGADAAVTGTILRATGYRCAFLCGGGPSRLKLPICDPWRIDRLAVYRDTDLVAELAIRDDAVDVEPADLPEEGGGRQIAGDGARRPAGRWT